MSEPTYTQIPLDKFQEEFKDTSTEVSSVALGGRIVGFSDEFFAEAENLIKVEVRLSFPLPPSLMHKLMWCVWCGVAIKEPRGSIWAQRSAVRWVGDEEA